MLLNQSLNGVRSGLPGADSLGLLEVEHPDLAVARLSGTGHVAERFQDLFRDRVVHGHFYLRLRQEIVAILRAAVDLGVAMLSSKTLYLGDRDPLNAEVRHRDPDLIQLERLDEGGDELHDEADRLHAFVAALNLFA